MTKIILAGGGDAQQSALVDEYFSRLIPKMKMLFIPQAIAPNQWSYEKAFEWIHKPAAFRDFSITMWKDLNGKTIDDLAEFDAIYLMGGNTFELLDQLRCSGFLALIPKALDMGKMIYGISAGAYILGKDISDRVPFEGEGKNKIGLTDLRGLDLLNGYKVHCHYVPSQDSDLFNFETEHRTPIIAIPETSAIVVENTTLKIVGYEPVSIFRPGKDKEVHAPGSSFALAR